METSHMVRSRWIKAVMATVVSTGMVWGQSAVPSSSQAPDDPTGRIITVNEAGKPAQKCRVVKVSVDEKGRKVLQVEAIDTHEVMTIVTEGAPIIGDAPTGGRTKTLRTQIFHWGHDNTPPAAICDSGCSSSVPIVTTGPKLPVITTAPSSGTTCPTCTPSSGSWGKPTEVACDSCKPGAGNWGSPSPQVVSAPTVITPAAPVETKVVTTTPTTLPKSIETPVATTTPKPTPKPAETKVVQAEPSNWRESWGKMWGKTDKPKEAATDTSKATDTKKPIVETKAETKTETKPLPPPDLPHVAETKKPDPLLSDPTKYSRRPLDEKLPAKSEVPPTDLSRLPAAGGAPSVASVGGAPNVASVGGAPNVASVGGAPNVASVGESLGAGARSVTDSGMVTSAPYPVAMLPTVNTGPKSPPQMPMWQMPQAPQPINPGRGLALEANQGGIAYNAFTPTEQTPPAPGTPAQGMLGNAFSTDTDPRPTPGVFGPMCGPPAPMMMPQGGYRPMAGMLPPSPYGPVVRMSAGPGTPNPVDQGTKVAMLPPQHGTGVMQTGYQAPAAPPAKGMPPPQLTTMLHDALYPSQREWAAEKMSVLDWKQNDAAVQALTQAMREDPAPTVRATCIHSLAKMKADSFAVVSAIQAAKKDTDARVRNEADEALSVIAPGAPVPTAPSPAVHPALAISPTLVPPPAPAPLPPPVPAPVVPAPSSSPTLPPLPN
jgi:hypothetical protein